MKLFDIVIPILGTLIWASVIGMYNLFGLQDHNLRLHLSHSFFAAMLNWIAFLPSISTFSFSMNPSFSFYFEWFFGDRGWKLFEKIFSKYLWS